MLKKGYIRSNILFCIVFILIVKKSNKEFKFYIKYRIFNAFIVLNQNVSSLIKTTLIKFYRIRIYNKFDIYYNYF